MKKNKIGELTTQQIVMLIILITSFAIILFLLFRLNLGKTTDKELCYNSVVTKGTSVLPKESISLNCQRQYTCITFDGSCEGLTKPEIVKVKTLDEVYKRLADEMADCWWMFGEGKVDYVGEKATKKNYCSICSQILFDDSLKNIKGIDESISKDKLYDYLANQKISGKENTYAEYLFGTSNVNQLKELVLEQHKVQGTFGNIEIGKQYFVVMGITNQVGGVVGWTIAGGATLGVVLGSIFIASNPIGWIAGAIIVGGVGAAGGIAAEKISDSINPEIAAIPVKGNGIDNQFMAPTIQEVDSKKFKSLNCEEILTLA